MITIIILILNMPHWLSDTAVMEHYQPEVRGLELAAVVTDTDDLTEAFDRVPHRNGENWTDHSAVIFFGDPRGRLSSHEGDVFMTSDGRTYLALPHGFRPMPGLSLPYQPARRQEFPPIGGN